ncbi:MAG: hypothetical protein L6R38_001453 [Xanthoria sp. 2 TBL-2021]|nr:MAG: hypothetical protein L6R38_001453 [Xanthoria sp. 2 TBL-2021]
MSPSTLGIKQWLKSLIALSLIDTVIANCYYPNGTDRNEGFPNDTYFPVNPGDDFSMCCSHFGDQPRGDGLCANFDGSVIWRESCTDRTWQSPKCIKLCAGSSPDTNNSPGIGRQMDNDEQVTPCSDGSYCCGDGSLGSSCCNQGRGVFVRDGTTQAANPTSTPASSSSLQSPSGSPTTTGVPAGPTRTTASSLAPATSSPRSNVNAGAIAGIVIGGLAGIVLLLGAVWFLCFRRRKAKKAARNDITQRQGYPPSSEVWGWPYGDHTKTEPQEAQGSYTGQYKRSELQAGPVSWTAGKSELDTQQILPPNATQLR